MSGFLNLVEAATALTQLVAPSNFPPRQAALWSTSALSHLPNSDAVPTTAGSVFASALSPPRHNITHNISDDDTIAKSALLRMAALRENHLQALRAAATDAGMMPAAPPAPIQQTPVQQAAVYLMNQQHMAISPETAMPPQQQITATAMVPNQQQGESDGATITTDAHKEMFPMRLHALLSDPNVRDVISWLPHGRSFVVLRPDVFAERVLPRYFAPEGSNSLTAKTTTVVGKDGNLQVKNKTPGVHKYPSFTRKLNRWGFRQISRGPDAGAFCHEMFQRDGPALCRSMVCQKSRKSKKMFMCAAGGLMDDVMSVSSASTMGTKPSVAFDKKRPYSSTVTVSTAGATSNKSLPFKKRKSGQMHNFLMNDIPSMISHRNQKMSVSTSSVTESDFTSEISSVSSSNILPMAPVQAVSLAVNNVTASAEITAMEVLSRHFHEQHRACVLASLMENSRLAMEAAGMNQQACPPTAAFTTSASDQASSADGSRLKYYPLGAMTTHSSGIIAPTVSVPEEKKMSSIPAAHQVQTPSMLAANAAKSALYKAYLQAVASHEPSP